MIDTIQRFRKKYTLAILLFITGSVLAFTNDASLGEYTAFAGVLLAIFGGADLVDKKVVNK
ncbi:MAG: hypothetical protein JRE40_13765 [Deltaproteobacteria bacterium]|nr:hypothetical protein [Deltaproteobacteria bacterium]